LTDISFIGSSARCVRTAADILLAIFCKAFPPPADEGCEQAWFLPEVEQALIT
jgi:hypothetical protein